MLLDVVLSPSDRMSSIESSSWLIGLFSFQELKDARAEIARLAKEVKVLGKETVQLKEDKVQLLNQNKRVEEERTKLGADLNRAQEVSSFLAMLFETINNGLVATWRFSVKRLSRYYLSRKMQSKSSQLKLKVK